MTTPTLDLNSVIVRSPSLVSSEIDQESVGLDVETGKYYGFDRIGTVIWREIAEPVRVGDLCQTLQARFDVEPERCRHDVLEYLGRLAKESIIEVRDGQAPEVD